MVQLGSGSGSGSEIQAAGGVMSPPSYGTAHKPSPSLGGSGLSTQRLKGLFLEEAK